MTRTVALEATSASPAGSKWTHPSVVCALALLTTTSYAKGDSPADLRLREFPLITPSTLSMRVADAKTSSAADTEATAEAAEDTEDTEDTDNTDNTDDALTLQIDSMLRDRIRASDALGERRSLDEKVVLQVSLGVGLDGGQPSEQGLLTSGAALDENESYARLRTYGFGDLAIGTNGLGTESLRSYLAATYRFDGETNRPSSPIPTVFDGDFNEFVVRSAWIDVDDVFATRALRPLRIRVGRQYKYTAAIAHFTGLTLGYTTDAVSVSMFAGTRADSYGFGSFPRPPAPSAISGADINVDLYELRKIPLVFTASALRFDRRTHLDGSAALRYGRNALIRARVRTLAGSLAQEIVRIRARVSEVTTVSALVDNRHAADWSYDLLLARRSEDPTDPRNYLDLAPPRPRVRGAMRAGTVLLRNIDLLASIAGALEYADESEVTPASTRSSYLEAGSAVELRLRRGIRLGASATGRVYRRPADQQQTDSDDPDGLLENFPGTGETSFLEGGTSLNYSLGARIFSAAAEFYARAFRFQSTYGDVLGPDSDTRSGARFSIDGWATSRIRVRLNYDLSLGEIRFAPELTGVKSLRAMVEGTF